MRLSSGMGAASMGRSGCAALTCSLPIENAGLDEDVDIMALALTQLRREPRWAASLLAAGGPGRTGSCLLFPSHGTSCAPVWVKGGDLQTATFQAWALR